MTVEVLALAASSACVGDPSPLNTRPVQGEAATADAVAPDTMRTKWGVSRK